jgi:hypothetical protein
VTTSSLVMTFWVMHYIRVLNFLFTIWTSWVSKDTEFDVDFKNINLPLWQNAPKKVIQEKRMSLLHLCIEENLYPGLSFFRCILSQRWVYSFEIYVKFCIFWYPLPMSIHVVKKNFGPLYSGWPKMFWPTMKRSLGQNTFFVYFCYFWKVYVTNPRGTFVPVPISTHPTVYCTKSGQCCGIVFIVYGSGSAFAHKVK